jgi:hypothetical protein
MEVGCSATRALRYEGDWNKTTLPANRERGVSNTARPDLS